jgi:sarcosine oxidase
MKQPCFDIVVIGAGMFGSAAAKYLRQHQIKVGLIGPHEPVNKQEAALQRSFGAYYDQARITRRLGWDEVWGATDSRSLNRFRAIEAESGISFFHECGSLVLMAKTILSRTESILKHCQDSLIPVERVASKQIQSYWPFLRVPQLSGGVEGLYEQRMAGYLNPRKLVSAQLALFERSGGVLVRANVVKVEKDTGSGLWKLYTMQNQDRDIIYTKRVLISAGAFINHNGILPCGHKLELYAFTEPNLLFEIEQEESERLMKMPPLIAVDPEDVGNKNVSIYLLPPIRYPDGKWYLRIGPGMQPIVKQLDTLEEMREWYIEQQITDEQRDFLIQMKQKFIPSIQEKSIREACCIIEKTPSHYPYIGQIDEDSTLNVVTGGNGHGARGSDEIGRLAASAALGNAWDFPIEKSRFTPILTTAETPIRMECRPPFGLC